MLLFITEARFGRDAAGSRAPLNPANVDAQWAGYAVLPGFRLIARCGDDRSDFPATQLPLVALPYWRGPMSLARRLPRVLRAVVRLSRAEGIFVLRMPGTVSLLFAIALLVRRHSDYYVELVGDVSTVVRSTGLPGRRLLARLAFRLQAVVVYRAAGVRYLTRRELQAVYPTRALFTTAYSDVDLTPFLKRGQRDYARRVAEIVAVGSQEVPYKGHDVLIRAFALLGDPDMRLTIIGDGACRASLEALVDKLSVGSRVVFIPPMPRHLLAGRLRESDIFAMPSRSEGLGRALMEAMSMGLPAVATAVGGMKELLDPAMLVPPDDPDALADKLRSLISSSAERRAQGLRNMTFMERYLASQGAERERWLSNLQAAANKYTRAG